MDLLPAAPPPSVRTHSTCFHSTGGPTPRKCARTVFFFTNFLNTPRGPGHPGKIPGTSQVPPFETQGRQTFEGGHELFDHHPFAWKTPTHALFSCLIYRRCAPTSCQGIMFFDLSLSQLARPGPRGHQLAASLTNYRRTDGQQGTGKFL